MLVIMRTTVTLDDDVVAAVEAERRATGDSFREALNRLVRRGSQRQTSEAAPELPLLAGGPRVDITDISGVLGDLDDERVLERGG